MTTQPKSLWDAPQYYAADAANGRGDGWYLGDPNNEDDIVPGPFATEIAAMKYKRQLDASAAKGVL